jgi:hypothetical protein
MRIQENETTRQLKAEIEELNDFIAKVRVEGEGIQFTGWTRIFNEGDQKGFAWDRGGRLYARPQGSYQELSKDERLKLTIDGERVVEIDIRCSHLSIVYGLKGISPYQHFRSYGDDGYWTLADPYLIGDLPRAVVKAWVTITLGAGKPPRRWSKKAIERLTEEQVDLKAYDVKQVGAAVLERHPVLADLGDISWAKLQFIESQVIVRTMLRLKREHAIPALPVHDSLIVPRQAWWVAGRMLQEVYEAVLGHKPMVPKLTPPMDELPGPLSTRYAYLLAAAPPPEEPDDELDALGLNLVPAEDVQEPGQGGRPRVRHEEDRDVAPEEGDDEEEEDAIDPLDP